MFDYFDVGYTLRNLAKHHQNELRKQASHRRLLKRIKQRNSIKKRTFLVDGFRFNFGRLLKSKREKPCFHSNVNCCVDS